MIPQVGKRWRRQDVEDLSIADKREPKELERFRETPVGTIGFGNLNQYRGVLGYVIGDTPRPFLNDVQQGTDDNQRIGVRVTNLALRFSLLLSRVPQDLLIQDVVEPLNIRVMLLQDINPPPPGSTVADWQAHLGKLFGSLVQPANEYLEIELQWRGTARILWDHSCVMPAESSWYQTYNYQDVQTTVGTPTNAAWSADTVVKEEILGTQQTRYQKYILEDEVNIPGVTEFGLKQVGPDFIQYPDWMALYFVLFIDGVFRMDVGVRGRSFFYYADQ